MTASQIDDKILELTWKRTAIYQERTGSGSEANKFERWEKLQQEIEQLTRQKQRLISGPPTLVVPL
jgi:hypothetical protein